MGPPRSRCAARRIGERGNSTSGSSTRRFRQWRRASGRGRDCAERRSQLEEQGGEAPKERLSSARAGSRTLNLGIKRVRACIVRECLRELQEWEHFYNFERPHAALE